MRTIYQQHRLKKSPFILVLFSAMLFIGCSGYQSVSYYQDGIYGDVGFQEAPQQAVSTAAAPQQSGTYYKNYFAEKASQGIQDEYIFIDSEEYQTPTPEQTSAGNYQAHGSWGDQTDRININIIDNQPFGWNMGWGWYDAPYTFGRSAFWGHNYHPWYFTYGFYHNNFYNPYRFGWGARGNYWNGWGYQNPYWDRYYNRNTYRNGPIYSRLNGSRTIARNYTPSRSARSVNSNSATTTNRTTARSTTRTNTNTNVQRGSTTTTQRRQGVSTTNRTPSRTTTRRNSSSTNPTTTNQPRSSSNRNHSNNNSTYRSSSSSSNNSYKSSTPSRTTNSSRRSSPSRSSSPSRRR